MAKILRDHWWIFVALAAILLLPVLLMVSRPPQSEVIRTGWERRVEVMAQGRAIVSGWDLPAGARFISSEMAGRGSRKVQVGTEEVSTIETSWLFDHSVGRMRFLTYPTTEQRPVYEHEPIYAERFTYEISAPQHVRTESLSGDDAVPRTPVLKLAPGESAGEESTTYTATIIDPRNAAREVTFAASKEVWSRLRRDPRVIIAGGRMSGERVIRLTGSSAKPIRIRLSS